MRIFYDCTYLRNAHTGVDIYFISLIPQILKNGPNNEYIIFVDSRYNQFELKKAIDEASNVQIKTIYSPLPLQVLYAAFLFPFYLRFKKVDIYHNPYFFGPLFGFISHKTKVVITVHDMYHRTIPKLMNPVLNVLFRLFADYAIKMANEVIVISQQTKKDVVKFLKIDESKLNLVHQALNSKFNELSNNANDYIDKHGLEREKYLLTIGKVLPSKGLDDLIVAFKAFLDKSPDKKIKLVSVGMHPTNYVDKIRSLILELELTQNVLLLGYVSDLDILILYENCNIVVVPSHYEGFGLPILEGMKFRKPVIARNASSLTEVLGDGGKLFNTNLELADLILEVNSNQKLRDDLIVKGDRRLKYFSWENTAKKTLIVYNK